MIARHTLSFTTVTFLSLAACSADAPRAAAVDSPQPGAAHATTARDTTGRAVVDSSAWVATPQRLGRIHTGMSRRELIALVGQPRRAGYQAPSSCSYINGTALPPGVQVMLLDSTVARIDITEPGVPTAEGIAVGSSEQEVLARYKGDAVVTPHKYSGPEWHYVTVTVPHDTLHRMVFETDGAVVKRYRIGKLPAVEWVEGCS